MLEWDEVRRRPKSRRTSTEEDRLGRRSAMSTGPAGSPDIGSEPETSDDEAGHEVDQGPIDMTWIPGQCIYHCLMSRVIWMLTFRYVLSLAQVQVVACKGRRWLGTT